MRAKLLYITDHAYLRWNQRICIGNAVDIQHAVEQSKIVKKCELLPYSLPRLKGSVYSVYNKIMFVFDPVAIDEFRLVTVISSSDITRSGFPKEFDKKKNRLEKKLEKKKFLRALQERKEEKEECLIFKKQFKKVA